jgi:hypothetical protein
MLQMCDMGKTALLPFRRKACWGFFRPKKSDSLGNRGQHANYWTTEAALCAPDDGSKKRRKNFFNSFNHLP